MKKTMYRVITIVLALALVLALAACGNAAPAPAASSAPAEQPKTDTPAAPAASGFTPPATLEFICCYGAGGGHDTMLRNMDAILSIPDELRQPSPVRSRSF